VPPQGVARSRLLVEHQAVVTQQHCSALDCCATWEALIQFLLILKNDKHTYNMMQPPPYCKKLRVVLNVPCWICPKHGTCIQNKKYISLPFFLQYYLKGYFGNEALLSTSPKSDVSVYVCVKYEGS
jgi:hypothetical protein